MRLRVAEIKINTLLTHERINSFYCHVGRFHLITDLARKGPKEICLFLDRISEILKSRQFATEYSSKVDRFELSLITVLSEDDADPSSSAFPLFDFLGIELTGHDGSSEKSYGVMFSTYIHDLDREAIQNPHEHNNNFDHSRQLVDALFFPAKFNNFEAPFLNKYPIFIFPASPSDSLQNNRSRTAQYLNCLGFEVSIISALNNTFLQAYRHRCDSRNNVSHAMHEIILATGFACAEMVAPNLYTHLDDNAVDIEKRPQPFDRSVFNSVVKLQQKQSMQQWLAKHGHLLDP